MSTAALKLAFAMVAAAAACSSGEPHAMPEQEDPISSFEEAIGLDRIVEPGEPRSGVAVAWPSPIEAPQLAGRGWAVESAEVAHRDHGAEGEWILKRGEETLLLRVFVSSEGPQPARRQLIDVATATMMMEIPFRKTEQPIGTLSVSVPDAEDGNIIWIFRNVCFHARGMDTELDVEGFARWLQGIAESGAVDDLSPHLPKITRFQLDPAAVAAGQSFAVRAAVGPLEGGEDLPRYSYDFAYDTDLLELDFEESNRATFIATRAGAAEVTVQVVDRETLLSSWRSETIRIDN